MLAETVIGAPLLAIVNFAAMAALLALSLRFIDPEAGTGDAADASR